MPASTPHLAGQKIRRWREARKLSAEEFGEQVDEARIVPAQTVYSWETRGRVAHPRLIERLADMGVCDLNDWVRPAAAAPDQAEAA